MSKSTAGFRLLSSLPLLLLIQPAIVDATTVRTRTAIQSIKMSIPMPLEEGLKQDLLGLDREPKELRERLLEQARAYADYRKSGGTWIASCQHPAKDADENPFCHYELERRPNSPSRIKSSRHALQRVLANDLAEGHFAKVRGQAFRDVLAATGLLDQVKRLDAVASRVAESAECVPSTVPAAIGFRIEERFPAPEAIELVKRLYRKSSDCGNDLAAAQASFRLGLLEIWEHRCDQIPQLMQKVEAVPEAAGYHPRAKYWRYYCAGQKNDPAAQALAKESLLKDHPMSFQTLAISGDDEQAMAKLLGRADPRIALRSIVRPDLNPLLRAYEALVRIGALPIANELIDRSVNDIGTLEPEVRLYISTVLSRTGAALPKFKILTELFQEVPDTVTAGTLRLFFPLHYIEIIKAKMAAIDPLLILSLIRQESAFNKNARSIVGARGLMQVMPKTARGMSRAKVQKLFDPEINIGIGTKYFSKQLHENGGDVELTLAAYNAGILRVDQWKRRYPTDNRLLFLDLIPFRETRDYVSSILRNYYWYVKLYSPTERALASEKTTASSHGGSMKVLAIMNANAAAAAMNAIGGNAPLAPAVSSAALSAPAVVPAVVNGPAASAPATEPVATTLAPSRAQPVNPAGAVSTPAREPAGLVAEDASEDDAPEFSAGETPETGKTAPPDAPK